MADARAEGERTAFRFEEVSSQDIGEDNYMHMNQIHTGTSSQVGLALLPCAKALGMEAFTNSKSKTMYRSNDPNLSKSAVSIILRGSGEGDRLRSRKRRRP